MLNTIAAVKLMYKINLLNFFVEHLFFECQTESGFSFTSIVHYARLRMALDDISIILVRNL